MVVRYEEFEMLGFEKRAGVEDSGRQIEPNNAEQSTQYLMLHQEIYW